MEGKWAWDEGTLERWRAEVQSRAAEGRLEYAGARVPGGVIAYSCDMNEASKAWCREPGLVPANWPIGASARFVGRRARGDGQTQATRQTEPRLTEARGKRCARKNGSWPDGGAVVMSKNSRDDLSTRRAEMAGRSSSVDSTSQWITARCAAAPGLRDAGIDCVTSTMKAQEAESGDGRPQAGTRYQPCAARSEAGVRSCVRGNEARLAACPRRASVTCWPTRHSTGPASRASAACCESRARSAHRGRASHPGPGRQATTHMPTQLASVVLGQTYLPSRCGALVHLY